MKYNEKGSLVIETERERELRYEILNTDYHEIDQYPSKHDCHYTVIVFPWEDKNWKCSYESSYNEGIQFYGEIECIEVEEREVTVKKWLVVKK